MQSDIPLYTTPPVRKETTKTHVGFHYVHIITTYQNGRIEESFECNCHVEKTEQKIKVFMEKIFL
jgi:hypothetical protein